MTKDIFDQMAARWPSEVVARTAIKRFTGEMISGKYIANLDSEGKGPVRITIGRKVGYPVKELVDWLRGRSPK